MLNCCTGFVSFILQEMSQKCTCSASTANLVTTHPATMGATQKPIPMVTSLHISEADSSPNPKLKRPVIIKRPPIRSRTHVEKATITVPIQYRIVSIRTTGINRILKIIFSVHAIMCIIVIIGLLLLSLISASILLCKFHRLHIILHCCFNVPLQIPPYRS